jgi:DNA-binding NtrC family response regulator
MLMIPTRQLNVFVVDDERVIASTLATILKQSGFAAVAFTNPFEALRVAEADPPDLLISDVVMPELSGIDLALRMHALCPNCKIMLFSSQSASAGLLDLVRGKESSFDFLMKPVHPTELLRAIRKLSN